MAGIYIHIPFCRKRCTYCDFYTEVAPEFIPKLIDSIVTEFKVRSNYLKNAEINSIYFGGGTPSVLTYNQFNIIFETIFALFSVNENAEITFEANPDDLNPDFFESIRELPFNRISIGIQSFDDKTLKMINRRHTANQAVEAVKNAQRYGFKNVSIDLIYGLPNQSYKNWNEQLEIALSLNVQHISAYGLTYEEGTELWKQREKGKINQLDDETMNKMYLLLVKKMKQSGFEAYEISNFARLGFRSRHNSSYWQQLAYLGVGPAAHSFDLNSRQWNVSSISDYISALASNKVFFEREELTIKERYNDYIMVSLRTLEGVDLKYITKEFGVEWVDLFIKAIQPFIGTKKIKSKDYNYSLTTSGVQISNQILIELMVV